MHRPVAARVGRGAKLVRLARWTSAAVREWLAGSGGSGGVYTMEGVVEGAGSISGESGELTQSRMAGPKPGVQDDATRPG